MTATASPSLENQVCSWGLLSGCLDGVTGQDQSGGGVALCEGAGLTCMEVGNIIGQLR